LTNLELQTKWFAEDTPTNAHKATAEIGSGTNGKVTIECASVGTEGNEYEVEVVIASGANKPMGAALVNGVLTVTLGTGADSNVAAAKNTAKLISEAISALPEFNATYSGDGSSSISNATSDNVAFDGGSYGTVCPIGGVWLKISNTYYYCSAPNSRYDANWRTVVFTAY
jgi:hypothetical protein